jgi:hypothetical protein
METKFLEKFGKLQFFKFARTNLKTLSKSSKFCAVARRWDGDFEKLWHTLPKLLWALFIKFGLLYTPDSKLFTVHCSSYYDCYTLLTLDCSQTFVYSIMFNVNSSLYNVDIQLFTLFSLLYKPNYTVFTYNWLQYSVNCTLLNIQCSHTTFHRILFPVHSKL